MVAPDASVDIDQDCVCSGLRPGSWDECIECAQDMPDDVLFATDNVTRACASGAYSNAVAVASVFLACAFAALIIVG